MFAHCMKSHLLHILTRTYLPPYCVASYASDATHCTQCLCFFCKACKIAEHSLESLFSKLLNTLLPLWWKEQKRRIVVWLLQKLTLLDLWRRIQEQRVLSGCLLFCAQMSRDSLPILNALSLSSTLTTLRLSLLFGVLDFRSFTNCLICIWAALFWFRTVVLTWTFQASCVVWTFQDPWCVLGFELVP